jgi:hypothetical protein
MNKGIHAGSRARACFVGGNGLCRVFRDASEGRGTKIVVWFVVVIFLSAVCHAEMGQGPLLDVFDLPSVDHTIVATSKGFFPVLNTIGNELFAVFRAGGGYLSRNGSLEGMISYQDGKKWYAPTIVADGPQDDRNGAVGVLADGKIVVVYREDSRYRIDGSFDNSVGSTRCLVTFSLDQGDSWMNPVPLSLAGFHDCVPYGRIVSKTDGTLFLTMYGPYIADVTGIESVRRDQPQYAYLIRSYDRGLTWVEPSLIAPGHNETALLLLPDGRLQAAARSSHVHRINVTRSWNDGQRWSSPIRLTDINQHPADMIHFSNGWILLVYGDRSGAQSVIRGVLSRDQGDTWDILHSNILFSRPAQGDFGYPSVARLPSGRIAVMYYWAGYANNIYDGTKARLYCTSFREEEFISVYEQYLTISPMQ